MRRSITNRGFTFTLDNSGRVKPFGASSQSTTFRRSTWPAHALRVNRELRSSFARFSMERFRKTTRIKASDHKRRGRQFGGLQNFTHNSSLISFFILYVSNRAPATRFPTTAAPKAGRTPALPVSLYGFIRGTSSEPAVSSEDLPISHKARFVIPIDGAALRSLESFPDFRFQPVEHARIGLVHNECCRIETQKDSSVPTL